LSFRLLLAVAAALSTPSATVEGTEQVRFLLISSASERRVSYIPIQGEGPLTTHMDLRPLISVSRQEEQQKDKENEDEEPAAAQQQPDTKAPPFLAQPAGICVDKRAHRLYVAEPLSRMILWYGLAVKDGQLTADDGPHVAQDNVDARWVAVDGAGDLFWTDSDNNKIMKVSTACLSDSANASKQPCNATDVNGTAMELYSAPITNQVSEPAGVKADVNHVYWGNQVAGMQDGALIKGNKTTAGGLKVHTLANNTEKAIGVCVAPRHIFYTDGEYGRIYGVRKGGSAVTVVAQTGLSQPRGCTWDDDNTIFVADKGLGTVWSFAAGTSLAPRMLSKHLPDHSFPGALDVAHYAVEAPQSDSIITKTVKYVSSIFGGGWTK